MKDSIPTYELLLAKVAGSVEGIDKMLPECGNKYPTRSWADDFNQLVTDVVAYNEGLTAFVPKQLPMGHTGCMATWGEVRVTAEQLLRVLAAGSLEEDPGDEVFA